MWALRKTKELWLAIFKKRVLRKIYGPVYDSQPNEWRKFHNYELQMQFQSSDIIKEITKIRLTWVGHVWHKQGFSTRQVIEVKPIWKKTFRKPQVKMGRLCKEGYSKNNKTRNQMEKSGKGRVASFVLSGMKPKKRILISVQQSSMLIRCLSFKSSNW